mmetsp:Transcript_27843/g.62959  ORF Transcript_27843/g.62959 Transcript_27843/m.62959 type:complete len:272 (-) Transcript_27843:819-1634(-)
MTSCTFGAPALSGASSSQGRQLASAATRCFAVASCCASAADRDVPLSDAGGTKPSHSLHKGRLSKRCGAALGLHRAAHWECAGRGLALRHIPEGQVGQHSVTVVARRQAEIVLHLVYPRVQQCLCGRWPPVHLLLKQLADEQLAGLAGVVKAGTMELHFPSQGPPGDRSQGRPREGNRLCEDKVVEGSGPEDVHLLVARLGHEDLWCGIPWSTDAALHLLVVGDEAGDTKVRQPHSATGIKQHVLRLHIAVDHSLLVEVGQARQDASHDLP